MTKKSPPKRSRRNWKEWHDSDDHTGINPVDGKYDHWSDYRDSEDYPQTEATKRANAIEQALIFTRKLLTDHAIQWQSDGIAGEKIIIVLAKAVEIDETALRHEYEAAGYGSIMLEFQRD